MQWIRTLLLALVTLCYHEVMKQPKEQINLRVEPEVAERLRRLSLASGIKINFIIEKAVITALAVLEEKHRDDLERYARDEAKQIADVEDSGVWQEIMRRKKKKK